MPLAPAILIGLASLGLLLQLALPRKALPPPAVAAGRAPQLKPLLFPAVPEFGEIAEQPLFAPDRSAAGGGDAAQAGAGGEPALVGLALDRRRAVALVQLGGGPIRTLRPGESVGGWRLVQVARNGAVLTRGSEVRRLQVEPAPGPPAASAGAEAGDGIPTPAGESAGPPAEFSAAEVEAAMRPSQE